jgi:hypothetical protein
MFYVCITKQAKDMETNIPTAENYLNDLNCHSHLDDGRDKVYYKYGVHKAMIEFAKLHCESQLKAILDKAKPIHKGYGLFGIDKDSITNAYDLNQIK